MPEGFATKNATGKEFAGMKYRLQVSPLDCTGCGNCVDVCPLKDKEGKQALVMKPLDSQRKEEANWEYAMTVPEVASKIENKASVKNSQALTARPSSPCSSSPAPAPAAARRPTSSWLPSCSATA